MYCIIGGFGPRYLPMLAVSAQSRFGSRMEASLMPNPGGSEREGSFGAPRCGRVVAVHF